MIEELKILSSVLSEITLVLELLKTTLSRYFIFVGCMLAFPETDLLFRLTQ